MKKKLLLVLVSTVGLMVAGCGANATVKDAENNEVAKVEVEQKNDVDEPEVVSEMTFSEMLQATIDKYGEVVFYTCETPSIKDEGVTKDMKVYKYSYDGEKVYRYLDDSNHAFGIKMGEIARGEDADGVKEDIVKALRSNDKFTLEDTFNKIVVSTDGSGNNTAIEGLYYGCTGELLVGEDVNDGTGIHYYAESSGTSVLFPIGDSSREQIYDKTYLVFRSQITYSGRTDVYYVIFPENEITEGKEITFDTPQSKNVEVDTVDELSKYYLY